MKINKTTNIIDERELREWITSKLAEYNRHAMRTCIFCDDYKIMWHNNICSGKQTRQEFVDYLNTSLVTNHHCAGDIRV